MSSCGRISATLDSAASCARSAAKIARCPEASTSDFCPPPRPQSGAPPSQG